MEVKEHKIAIVGCGPGSPDYLTAAARGAIEKAEVIVGTERLLALFPGLGSERITLGKDTELILREIAARRGRPIAVLVTGDPGLYSLASLIIKRFGRDACKVVPGISSIQTAFARLGLAWQDAKIISAHASAPEFSGEELCTYGKIAILGGDKELPRHLTPLADFMGRKGYRIFLCEDLTLPEERIYEIGAAGLEAVSLSARAVILIVRKDML
jgi:cobalt-precorrin-7 (C5)-methyltransferase